MPANPALRIPKTLKKVTVWLQTGGRVEGSMFVHAGGRGAAGTEAPEEVLNGPEPFVAIVAARAAKVRFHAKKAVVKVSCREPRRSRVASEEALLCRLVLADQTVVEGELVGVSRPTRTRLFDYLNSEATQFLRVEVGQDETVFVNRDAVVTAEEP